MTSTTLDTVRADRLRKAASSGGPLDSQGRSATVRQPEWFDDIAGTYVPTDERQAMHDEILHEFRDNAAGVRADRIAIVMAGPPGAGKSGAWPRQVAALGRQESEFLHIDPDEFKDKILVRMNADGSLERIVPENVRELHPQPRELAGLVHQESLLLNDLALNSAVERGDNIIIDKTLPSYENGHSVVAGLRQSGYQVHLVCVDADRDTARDRAIQRHRDGSARAESEDATETDRLGGRIVPDQLYDYMYDEQGSCRSTDVATRLALDDELYVETFVKYKALPNQDAPVLEEVRDRRLGMDQAYAPDEYGQQQDKTLDLAEDEVAASSAVQTDSSYSPPSHSGVMSKTPQSVSQAPTRDFDESVGNGNASGPSVTAEQEGLVTTKQHGAPNGRDGESSVAPPPATHLSPAQGTEPPVDADPAIQSRTETSQSGPAVDRPVAPASPAPPNQPERSDASSDIPEAPAAATQSAGGHPPPQSTAGEAESEPSTATGAESAESVQSPADMDNQASADARIAVAMSSEDSPAFGNAANDRPPEVDADRGADSRD